MTEPSAKVIADSVSPKGVRLTTLEIVMHRFVLAESNTHRTFSRNSSSSRAVPVRKQLQKYLEDPAYPIEWPAEQSGMQGGELLEGPDWNRAVELWSDVQNYTYSRIRNYLTDVDQEKGKALHKSLLNRLLEPMQWHTVVVTSTRWENFFNQRLAPEAMPEIRVAAEKMKVALNHSEPRDLQASEWHLPYLSDDERGVALGDAVRISAARCARVSYERQGDMRKYIEDLDLYERLADNLHMSPLEHICTPDPRIDYLGSFTARDILLPTHLTHAQCQNNTPGWIQLRQIVEAQRDYDSKS